MLNVEQNRRARKYSSGEIVRRVLWTFAQLFFRLSPRTCFGWRRFLLRCFGARIGRSVHVYPSATIYFHWNLEAGDQSAIGEGALIYNLGRVTLGARVVISHGAHVCAGTHDHTKSDFPLLRPPITIDQDAWICADAFVGPGVTIGEGAVVGARAER
jgi:putative colanic acid biosynthesis acetyltransferase WcaF